MAGEATSPDCAIRSNGGRLSADRYGRARAQQFGTDYARTGGFKARFLKQLRPVAIVHP